jgi:hypothetical protein
MHATSVDPYDEFENALMDLLTEPDRFFERRLRLRAVRARVNHFHGRYWQAVRRAFSVLDSPELFGV